MDAPNLANARAPSAGGRLAQRAAWARSPVMILLVLAGATVGAVVVGNGNLAVALAPSALALVIWGVWFLPLRVPVLVLLFLAWALEVPGDAFANGLVETPWKLLGSLLWGKLNLVLPFSPLVLSGFDLLALLLFAVIVYRHVRGSSLDQTGWVDSAAPLRTFALLSIVAVLWMSAYGIARGGSFRFVLWQSNRWIYLPIVYALMNQAIRGPGDAAVVGRVVLGVGLFRAAEAIIFRMMFPSVEFMPHATTHGDSVLFSTCVAILGAMVLEMPGRQTIGLAAALLPFFALAIQANNRRLVWAEIGLVAIFIWWVTPWRPLKRLLARWLVLGSLPLVLYAAVGWNAPQSVVFWPVQKVRSMTDSSANTSTLWRDLEIYNLVYTYSQNPLVGSGFGHPFIERVKLPDVSKFYELEPYIPHNSVLGLWAFGGLLGFALIWAVFPVGFFFTVRAYRYARNGVERVTALATGAVQICYLMQGYGDLGFGHWGCVFTIAAGYALVGKICVANGGWALATASPPDAAAWKAAPLQSVPPITPARPSL
jgi:O-antigen ligase